MGLIGSALGAVGSIFGGISASNAMKKARERVEQQQEENQDWYDRRYNEDATQRADAQRILTLTEDNIRNRNRQAAGTQAVMGGTDESTAATKAANSAAQANATATIATNAEQRKDAIEGQYKERDSQLENQLENMEINKANVIAQATQGLASAVGDMEFGDVKIGKTKIPL